MADLRELQNVLIKKEKRKSKPLPKVECFSLLFFEGNKEQRCATFYKVTQELNSRVRGDRSLMLRPHHSRHRDYDHLEMRVIDENNKQIQWYFDILELIPSVCRKLSIPHLTERPSDGY